jgi:hypothetical protein
MLTRVSVSFMGFQANYLNYGLNYAWVMIDVQPLVHSYVVLRSAHLG